MDTFERDLGDRLRRAAGAAGLETFGLDLVYGRAHRLRRERTTRITFASVGAAAALGWGLVALAGHPLASDQLQVVTPPSGSASPVPSASAPAGGGADSPAPGSPTPTPSATTGPGSAGPVASESSQPEPEWTPDVSNGPALPDGHAQWGNSGPDGVYIDIKPIDPDGFIRHYTVDFKDPYDPSGSVFSQSDNCTAGTEEHGNGPSVGYSYTYRVPGTYTATVTVVSGTCTDPVEDTQTVSKDLVVVASATSTPPPRLRDDRS